MKKVVSLILCLALMFMAVCCGRRGQSGQENGQESGQENTQQESSQGLEREEGRETGQTGKGDSQAVPSADTDSPFYLQNEESKLALGEMKGDFLRGLDIRGEDRRFIGESGDEFHIADCGTVTVSYVKTAEGARLWNLQTNDPVWSTQGAWGEIRVGDWLEDLTDRWRDYGDTLLYVYGSVDEGLGFCRYTDVYVYLPEGESGCRIYFYILEDRASGENRISGIELLDAAGEALTADNIKYFPLRSGKPDFSGQTLQEKEEISPTRRVFLSYYALTNFTLTVAEEQAYRESLFANLPHTDWGELSRMEQGLDRSAAFNTLSWLADTEISEPEEIQSVFDGTGTNLDGASSEDYAFLLGNLFRGEPYLFLRLLAGCERDTAERVVRLLVYNLSYRTEENLLLLDEAERNGDFSGKEKEVLRQIREDLENWGFQ